MDFDRILELSGKMLSSEQRQVVFSDKATIVSAGAGSGKTTVLALRFLRLVNDGIDADRILTLTFTKKAAAEMYGRIHGLLSKASVEDERLGLQLREKFPSASISTMDSFWTDIARSGCFGFGITRNFSIEDADSRLRLVRKAISLLGELENPVGCSNEEFYEALEMFNSFFSPEQVEDALLTIAKNTDIMMDVDSEFASECYSRIKNAYEKAYKPQESILNCLKRMQELYKSHGSKSAKSMFNNGAFARALEMAEKNEFAECPTFNLQVKHLEDRMAADTIKEIVKEYREHLKNYYVLIKMDANMKYQIFISRVIQEFLRIFNNEKRKAGILSFADIQAIAKKTLISNTEIRNYYKSRFDYIMVDEFQDNNLEQRDILYLLSEDMGNLSPGIPSASELDKKKLFFVGDDKQSIYRFRGADVSVFNALKKEVVEGMEGNALTLGTNFRSEPQLVNHFNDIFADVFVHQDEDDPNEDAVAEFRGTDVIIADDPAQPVKYVKEDYHAEASRIMAGRSSSDFKSVIEIATVPYEYISKEEKDDYLSSAECEASYIASKVEEMVLTDAFLIPDGKGSLKRPSYDDIGILYRTSAIQMHLEKVFRHRNIPYTVVESTSSTLDDIAYDLFNFLQLVAYPNDKLAFMSVINSPFARISDDGQSFLRVFRDDGFEAFREEVTFELESDRIAYDNLKSLYLDIRAKTGRLSLASILETLYYSSGYHTYIQSSNSLSVYSEHFDYLWETASNFDRDGVGIIGFLDYLRPLVGSSKKLEDVSIGRLNSSGVKLMTIHKSKGLEFPVVILANASSRPKPESGAFINIDTMGRQFVSWDVSDKSMEGGEKNPYSGVFNQWVEKRLSAERKRLLYVALTRAVNHLVIVAERPSKAKTYNDDPDKNPRESLFGIYNASLDRVVFSQKGPVSWTVVYKTVPLIMKDKEVIISPARRDMKWYEDALVYPDPVWNPKKVAAKDASHVELEGQLDGRRLPPFPVDGILSGNPSFRTGFGTWVHAALEEKMSGLPAFKEFESDELLPAEDLDAIMASAKKIADDFVSSQFCRKYIEGREVQTELAFFYPDGERVLQGSADLVVLGSDYNLVVDYKTDKYMNPAQHKGQISTYVRAIEDLYGKKCYGTVCYVRDFSSGPIWDREGNEVEL